MNRSKLVAILLLVCLVVSCLVSCAGDKDDGKAKHVDYAGELKLDMDSADTKKLEVSAIHLHVDGDTVHFEVDSPDFAKGEIVKARFLAVDTPESTGKIEEWGKSASEFTKNALKNAESIVIESNDEKWNTDSNGRYLLFIWYKPQGGDSYRNLNIELLQNGLAIAYNTGGTRYGEAGFNAIAQAKAEKLNMYSGQKDPNFYYGDAIELDIKELRANISDYVGKKVAFEAVVAADNDRTAYVEEFDPETGVYFGITVYYGYQTTGDAYEMISGVGNRLRIVGVVSLYEANGTYQVSGLKYRAMEPDDPDNLQIISEDNSPAYFPVTADQIKNGTVTFTIKEQNEDGEYEEVEKTIKYGDAALSSTVSLKNLKVNSVSVTTNTESSQYGALTLRCTSGGVNISVRTTVFRDENGDLIESSYFTGKTIDVKGIVDYYLDDYQIKVFSLDDIVIY